MANKKTLTSWLVENRERLNPAFVQFDWPNRYFNGLSDFKATLNIEDFAAIGRGIDISPEIALEKASAEAIERLICHKLNISSGGCAVAGEISAQSHARHEALERYYFDEHIEIGRPFHLIEKTISPLSMSANLICEQFKSLNPNIGAHFYKMAVPDPYYGIVCNISPTSEAPQILGLSLHIDPTKALKKALKEALMNYARQQDNPKSFAEAVNADSDLWICNPRFMEKITTLFSNTPWTTTATELPELIIEKIDTSSIEQLSGCPINPVRCIARKRVSA